MFEKVFLSDLQRVLALCLIAIVFTITGCLHAPTPSHTLIPDTSTSEKNSSELPQTAQTTPEAFKQPIPETPVSSDKQIEGAQYANSAPALDESDNLSTRLLVDEARELACTGAIMYRDGRLEEAHANLEAAILNLQLADLPADMQAISFFQPYLPEQCRTVNLKKAYDSLNATKSNSPFSSDDVPEALDAFGASDRAFIEMEIVRLMEIFGEDSSRQDELDIFTEEVEKFINYYLTKKRGWFERSYYRMLKYRDTTDGILAEKRLPPELAYLAFIESGYMYRATSRAQARGIWQFIRSTGRNYGLKVGRGIDERLDPIKATIAAREYLLDLISIFGSESFLLAMASYNAGEGRVQRCLRKVDDPFENRSFWQIRGCLRRETREYIPRIIAAAVLCENPGRFGIELKPRHELLDECDILVCPRRVRLRSIAKAAGISLKQLRQLNPDLPSGGSWTPVNNTHLYIPNDTLQGVKVALRKMETAPEPTFSGTHHIVRRGESLYSIGKRHRVPYKRLADWNNIPPPYKIKPGQKIYLQPPSSSSSGTITPSSSVTCDESLVYVVQKGNFLAGIGAIFGSTAREIMNLNKLRRGTIYPGQRLAVCPGFPVEIVKHRVKSGETVTKVASKYGVKVDEILFTNGINSRSTLKVGKQLTIYRRK